MQLFQRISHFNGLKCQGGLKFSNSHCDLILLQIFFILISLITKVPLILHTKFQPNILCYSGENADFIVFAISSTGGHLEFLIRPNFTVLRHWSLIMLHVKFEIHGCSG